MMPTNDNEINKVIDELNEEINVMEIYISNLQKKSEKWDVWGNEVEGVKMPWEETK